MPQVHPHHKAHPARRFSVSLASLCAAILSVVGVYAVTGSHAAVQQLYVTSASSSVMTGNTFNMAVYLNTGGESVNAVQANLTYNPSQLQFMSYSNAGGVLPLDAADSTASGNLQFTRSTTGGGQPVTGTGLIVTVTFKALAGSGTAAVTFGSGSSALRSSDSSNIVTATGSGTVALSSPATPTPVVVAPRTPTPTPVPSTGGGVTHTPTPAPASTGTKATPTPGISTTVSATPTPTAVPPVAAGTAQLYLTPASGSVAKGTTLKVGIRLKTAVPINAVQANLNYPKNLSFSSISGDGSALPLSAQSGGGDGTVTIVRSTQGGGAPITGDVLVATVTFTANADSGDATIGFASSSAVLTSSTSTNILSSPAGGTFTLISGGSTSESTPVPAPAPVSGVTTIVLPESGSGDPVSVGGTIQISADPSTGGTVVAYELDGHKVSSGKIDTTYLSNGTHTITAIITMPNGQRQTITQPISVNNKLSAFQKSRNTIVAAFGGRPGVALGAIITLVTLLLGAIGFLLIWPHLQAASVQNRLLHHPVAAPSTGFPAAAIVMPASSEAAGPEPVAIVEPAQVLPETNSVTPEVSPAPVTTPEEVINPDTPSTSVEAQPVPETTAEPVVEPLPTAEPQAPAPVQEPVVQPEQPTRPVPGSRMDGIKPPSNPTPPTV